MAETETGNSKSSSDRPGATVASSKKRDRNHGMYEDPLVGERTEDREKEFQRNLDALIDNDRLVDIFDFIQKYRPGTRVRPHRGVRGSYNVVFRLEYTDGDAILRVALPGVNAFADEKVRVEVATLRYIEKMTSIPVPHIYHWGTAAENPLGFGPFIIMDYISHKSSLDVALKDLNNQDPTQQNLGPNKAREKAERLYEQLASIMLQLSKLEMPQIGSLTYDKDDDSFTVVSRPLTQEMNDLVVMGGIPPSVLPHENTTYTFSQAWYEALADMHIAHLTFQRNGAIESPDDCRDKFMARYLFRQQVRQGRLLPPFRESTPEEGKEREVGKERGETFKLWIDDFRPHNILVDENLNIVGVIDWEWAYFAPDAYVHSPPWWLLGGKPKYRSGGILEFRNEFPAVLDVFCRTLRRAEDKEEQREVDEEEWDINDHLDALGLGTAEEEPTPKFRLSERMTRSWESGAFWANYAARRGYGFEPNTEGGFEGRIHLLPDKVQRRMESFVVRKIQEDEEEKIQDWEPQQAKAYLAEILPDLD